MKLVARSLSSGVPIFSASYPQQTNATSSLLFLFTTLPPDRRQDKQPGCCISYFFTIPRNQPREEYYDISHRHFENAKLIVMGRGRTVCSDWVRMYRCGPSNNCPLRRPGRSA